MDRKIFFICPRKNLINLVRAVHPREFQFLSEEPGRDEIDEISRELNPETSEVESDRLYREYTKEYGKRQRIAVELSRYENTLRGGRQNIVCNLGRHVTVCNRCSKEYHLFISRSAGEALKRKTNKLGTNILKRNKSRGIRQLYEGFIIDIDKDYLQLARYIFPEVK